MTTPDNLHSYKSNCGMETTEEIQSQSKGGRRAQKSGEEKRKREEQMERNIS